MTKVERNKIIEKVIQLAMTGAQLDGEEVKKAYEIAARSVITHMFDEQDKIIYAKNRD